MSTENPEPNEVAMLRLKIEAIGREAVTDEKAKPPITIRCSDPANSSVDVEVKMDVNAQGHVYIVEMHGSVSQLPPNLNVRIADGRIITGQLSR
jgi:hypothetical protein